MPPEFPLISIIICCYNRADMLRRTVRSAQLQTYKNTEIILFDDGSQDHTPAVAAEFGDTIRYIRQENTGIAVARTRACEAAEGEYIAFLDDDDLMPASRLQVLYELIAGQPDVAFAVGEIAIIDQEDNVVSCPQTTAPECRYANGLEAVLWPHVPATVHTTLFRRHDGEKIGWFDASFGSAGEDKDFFARLAQTGDIAYTPAVVSLYRRGHGGLSNDNEKVVAAQLRLFATALQNKEISAGLRSRMHQRIQHANEVLVRTRFATAHEAGSNAVDITDLLAKLSGSAHLRLRWYYYKQQVKHWCKRLV